MSLEIKRISLEEMQFQKQYTEKIRILLQDKPRYAYIQTFGCQQNEADSEHLAGMLAEMGYDFVSQAEDADLILVNTCAIREHAELKALSITGNFKHLKAKNPNLLIGICGCMVSQAHRKEDIKMKYPYVDFLFGTSMIYRLPEILYHTIKSESRSLLYETSEGNVAEGLPTKRKSAFQAWVSIMYGCNNYCTYCVVPYVRGRERSRYPEDILTEVKELIQNGYKEITLLGQNVNSYGKDLNMEYDFSDLLREIDAIDGEFWIRFMTSHPKDASEKLFSTMRNAKHIAHHFHLPLQSGSNRILTAMNRRYTKENFLNQVQVLRQAIPDIALTTDIIVGFPGETEEDFLHTMDVLEKVRFDNIYAFQYSPREGTPASKMNDQVPTEIKTQRFLKMMDLQTEICKETGWIYREAPVCVLVEGVSKTDYSKLTGRTSHNRLIHFVGSEELIGTFVTLKIIDVYGHIMKGELIRQ